MFFLLSIKIHTLSPIDTEYCIDRYLSLTRKDYRNISEKSVVRDDIISNII